MASLVSLATRSLHRTFQQLTLTPKINLLNSVNYVTIKSHNAVRSFNNLSVVSTKPNCRCIFPSINRSILWSLKGGSFLKATENLLVEQKRFTPTLNQIRRKKPRTKMKRPKKVVPLNKRILLGPQRKGVCVKLVVRTPRKPNSAQRKCAILRLNDGRLITAYMPGERANLQEHGVVLFRGGRVQDCPGLKYKIIRNKFDIN